MKNLKLDEVEKFVNKNIVSFHEKKIKILSGTDLKKLLKKKNPYLFKAKDITLAEDFIKNILEAYLSSSEEKIFGDFLEELAIFISSSTCGGRKSAATGIDIEFNKDNAHYLVSVKSGTNWGNHSQQSKQEQDFKKAERVLLQSNQTINVKSVLGICYGKTRTSFTRGALKIVGQNFWHFLSEDENLYTDIITPLGCNAKKYNNKFKEEKDRIINKFTEQFMGEFCDDGNINWTKIVKFNSGNLKK